MMPATRIWQQKSKTMHFPSGNRRITRVTGVCTNHYTKENLCCVFLMKRSFPNGASGGSWRRKGTPLPQYSAPPSSFAYPLQTPDGKESRGTPCRGAGSVRPREEHRYSRCNLSFPLGHQDFSSSFLSSPPGGCPGGKGNRTPRSFEQCF
jgi:hypothetical protein